MATARLLLLLLLLPSARLSLRRHRRRRRRRAVVVACPMLTMRCSRSKSVGAGGVGRRACVLATTACVRECGLTAARCAARQVASHSFLREGCFSILEARCRSLAAHSKAIPHNKRTHSYCSSSPARVVPQRSAHHHARAGLKRAHRLPLPLPSCAARERASTITPLKTVLVI